MNRVLNIIRTKVSNTFNNLWYNSCNKDFYINLPFNSKLYNYFISNIYDENFVIKDYFVILNSNIIKVILVINIKKGLSIKMFNTEIKRFYSKFQLELFKYLSYNKGNYINSIVYLYNYTTLFTTTSVIIDYIKKNLGFKIPIRIIFNEIYFKLLQNKELDNFHGIKMHISGRINNNERAFTENFIKGIVSLQTLKYSIMYSFSSIKTKYGTLGVKVWVFK